MLDPALFGDVLETAAGDALSLKILHRRTFLWSLFRPSSRRRTPLLRHLSFISVSVAVIPCRISMFILADVILVSVTLCFIVSWYPNNAVIALVILRTN
jgi:hypothetical protein